MSQKFDTTYLGRNMSKNKWHFIFWSVYLLWQVYVEYIMDSSSIANFTMIQKWSGAFLVELLILPPKLTASYLSFGVIKNIYLKSKRYRNRFIAGIHLLMIVVVATVLHRAISNYIAYPLELGKSINLDFFEPVYLISSAIDVLFVLGIFVGLNFALLQSKVVKRQIQLHKEKLEAELHYLKAQINPHFLFNTLNNIYSLSIQKSDLTPEAIVKLSKLMRFMIYDGSVAQIPMSKELEIIEDYLSLEKMRFTNRRLTLRFIKEVDDQDLLIAPLILLPFIENAFKHGASKRDGHTLINIHLSTKNRILNFEIYNINELIRQNFKKNIGLSNVERQLNILYTDFKLKIRPEIDKFTVSLYINLDSYVSN